ncbi:MAG: TIGR04282 family arsenosugar biosynthesis glycosyltransferase [Candidatus Handelsmanbacteria bacterium]|nr:TIGR04282 family arsenosugar biosynthesis glycosyltransferase [Candidatus Handelsmanbacteria bacterium]
MATCVLLFAKAPVPGKVKTRLLGCCTPEEAAALYRGFLLDSGALLRASGAALKVVACEPPGAREELAGLLGEEGLVFVPQPQAGLGERLEQLFSWAFAQGMERVLALGSDSPSLPAALVDDALALLEEREVVIGPSTDGGYYLIGLRRPAPALFAGIAWSSGQVLAQTLERLEGRSLGLLPIWYDVDTPQDAGLLKIHLEALARTDGEAGAHTRQVLQHLNLPFPS